MKDLGTLAGGCFCKFSNLCNKLILLFTLNSNLASDRVNCVGHAALKWQHLESAPNISFSFLKYTRNFLWNVPHSLRDEPRLVLASLRKLTSWLHRQCCEGAQRRAQRSMNPQNSRRSSGPNFSPIWYSQLLAGTTIDEVWLTSRGYSAAQVIVYRYLKQTCFSSMHYFTFNSKTFSLPSVHSKWGTCWMIKSVRRCSAVIKILTARNASESFLSRC